MTNYSFPSSNFESLLFRLSKYCGKMRRMKALGQGSVISPFATLKGVEFISIGKQVRIAAGTEILTFTAYGSKQYKVSIRIEDDVYIGKRCVISAADKLRIGSRTTVGDAVYIGGANHGYNDPTQSVLRQDLVPASIDIGENCWIGYGAFVGAMKPLQIGDGAILAAGSVVTSSVDAFTMVSGNPARPVKKYDKSLSRWIRL